MHPIQLPYSIKGTVVQGLGRGKQIGFPTINLESQKNIPFSGVFFVEVHLEEKLFYGLGHIGPRPTFGDVQFQIELHLYDFPEETIVPEEVEAILIKQIRDVQKFDGVDELVKQIAKDKETGEELMTRILRVSSEERND